MKKLIFILMLALAAGAAQAQVKFETKSTDAVREMAVKTGKLVFIDLYASWCPPCRMEIPELVKMHKKYEGKDVVIISLSVDEKPEVVPPFVRSMGMDYPVYMAGRDITRAFQVSSIPHNAFYSKDGQLVLSEPGVADGEIMEMVFKKLLSAQ